LSCGRFSSDIRRFARFAIGIYQRRKIHWPSRRTDRSLSGDAIYRAALVRQPDAQAKWPFRRVPVLVAVIAALGLLTWQEVMNGAGAPRVNVALAAYVFGVTAWLLCGWLLTNRAARDFERELAVLDSAGGPTDESSK
jgi:hypothetical protein